MNETQLKCADLIAEKLREREEEVRSLQERANESEYYGDEEEIYDFALSVQTDKLTTVCLSWGGPADYLEILWHGHSLAWEIKRVTYRYSDWFDTATMDVEEGSALWQYAQFIIEGEA